MNSKSVLLIAILLFSSVSIMKAQSFPRGILPGEDKEYKNISQKVTLTRGFYEGAPKKSSLKKYAPYAGNQGQFGTCTGWAVGYAARTIVEAQMRKWKNRDSITKNAFSATYQYRQCADYFYCDGAYTSEVVKSLQTKGALPEKEFLVEDGTDLCPTTPLDASNYKKAEKFKIEDYATLWKEDYDDLDEKIRRTKASLSSGNPVVISMICPRSFDKVKEDGLWSPTEDSKSDTSGRQHGRHALCVVGYDNDKFGGAFEVQNSWGDEWGNKGFVWIKYEDFSKFVYQAFEVSRMEYYNPEDVMLSGSLRLYDMDDEKDLEVELASKTRNWNVVGSDKKSNYTYKVKESLFSGTKMRMYLNSGESAYVYMIGTGEVDTSVNKLFPPENISPALNYPNSEVALPSENHYFQMDNTAGENYIIIIYSKKRLPIDRIQKKIKKGKGSLGDRVKKAIGSKLISAKHIKFNKSKIKFNVLKNTTRKTAFAMIIKFNQESK